MPSGDDALLAALERARTLGFLGPGPVVDHLLHAVAFEAALQDVSGRVIDLGSGGGVPGLVVAARRPDLEIVLVEAMAKRAAFLAATIERLALGRARVLAERAEQAGRGELRGTADAVVARGFGPPATTAECGAPLLRPGGLLIVSEPPDDLGRWPADGLALLGLAALERRTGPPALQVLHQLSRCPASYPRRDGVPRKRPLF